MDDLYICSLFVQHQANDLHTLKHLVASYLHKVYKKKQKMKWSQLLIHNTLDIMYGIIKR